MANFARYQNLPFYFSDLTHSLAEPVVTEFVAAVFLVAELVVAEFVAAVFLVAELVEATKR